MGMRVTGTSESRRPPEWEASSTVVYGVEKDR